jgi:hypothetical protein
MLSLLGSVLGFGTSFLPSILGFFEKGQSNKHELKMLEAKAKYADTLSKLKVQELDAEADIEETRSISAIQASVRPVITYFFFALFATIKGLGVYVAVQEGSDVSEAILNSWDQETAILFSTVISFWFGGRAMKSIRGSK